MHLVGDRNPQARRRQRACVFRIGPFTFGPRLLRCFPRVGAILDDCCDAIAEARANVVKARTATVIFGRVV
jgi:hypothetical protein